MKFEAVFDGPAEDDLDAIYRMIADAAGSGWRAAASGPSGSFAQAWPIFRDKAVYVVHVFHAGRDHGADDFRR